jgi:2-haloacid dehalogenase
MPPTTLAFDIYGTIADVHGVTTALEAHVGDRAPEFSRLWRQKQLEYTFRRALMEKYQDFNVCIRQSLAHACAAFSLELSPVDEEALLKQYLWLPVFPDVEEGLRRLSAAGMRIYAFSNGRPDAVSGLLEYAHIRDKFIDVVSCREVESYKPDPAVYHHFLKRAVSEAQDSWLISGNYFDCVGAVGAGMRSAWVRRSAENVADPWEIEPTITVVRLTDLLEGLEKFALPA